MSNKQLGIYTERAYQHHKETEGWVCWRSAASEGPADVTCIDKDNQYHGYQIKRVKKHKWLSSALSKARKEAKGLPVSIQIYCCEHRLWHDY